MLRNQSEGPETLGCADRNCPFTKHLGGMVRTNGGCKCLFPKRSVTALQDRRDIQRLIQWKDDEISASAPKRPGSKREVEAGDGPPRANACPSHGEIRVGHQADRGTVRCHRRSGPPLPARGGVT